MNEWKTYFITIVGVFGEITTQKSLHIYNGGMDGRFAKNKNRN